ncbi:MAG: DNA repair protein RecN [Sulfobacillus sp.]
MIKGLVVENLGLIRETTVEFGGGFNVITGESGSGKSLLLNAIGFVLGARASDLVGPFSDSARVRATFSVLSGASLWADLQGQGIEPDDWIIIQRELTKDGRSTYRVQGQLVPAQTVRRIATHLVEMTAQHHSLKVAEPDTLILWVDRVGDLEGLKNQVADDYRRWHEAKEAWDAVKRSARPEEIEQLQTVVEEINAAHPLPNEDELLNQELVRLRQGQRLMEGYQEVIRILDQDDGGVVQGFAKLSRLLDSLQRMDPSLEGASQLMEQASTLIEEAHWALNQWYESLNLDPDHLEQVEQRADWLARLKRKYGPRLDDVIGLLEESAARLAEVDNLGWELAQRERLVETSYQEYERNAKSLSTARRACVDKLAGDILELLKEMEMPGANMEFSITQGAPRPTGMDTIECLFAANPGQVAKPLAKMASGGELSRVALAMAVVEGRVGSATLVLDELDTGLGGISAGRVGELLARLGSSRQVLVVSHQPTVAARASVHIKIQKVVDGSSAESRAIGLDDTQGRPVEVARMLSGHPDSVALKHARQLLSREVEGA